MSTSRPPSSSSSSFCSGVVTTSILLLALFLSPISLLDRISSKTFPVIDPLKYDAAVFITGCSSGIGQAAGLKLAVVDKFHVFCTVRKEQDAARLQVAYEEQVRRAVVHHHVDENENDVVEKTEMYLHPVMCDVTKPEQVQAVKQIVENWLKVPTQDTSQKPRVLLGIVNNAGVSGILEPLEFLNIEVSLRWVLQVNLEAPLHVYQTFLPLLRQFNVNGKSDETGGGGGRIVNVGSLAGQAARPFRGAYTMSKFALEGLSDTMRQEVALETISVSMVNPGYTQTNIFQAAQDQTDAKYGNNNDDDDSSSSASRQHWSPLQRSMLLAYQQQTAEIAQTKAGSVDETTTAIHHALTSKNPFTRYYPGSLGIGPLQAWAAPKLKMISPDRWTDAAILKKLTSTTTTNKKALNE